MKNVYLTIDGKEVKTTAGQSVLWAALDNGVYIPNLCALREDEVPEAACRLCWVEVAGKARPVTACTEVVSDGMAVSTASPRAESARRGVLELLLAEAPRASGELAQWAGQTGARAVRRPCGWRAPPASCSSPVTPSNAPAARPPAPVTCKK